MKPDGEPCIELNMSLKNLKWNSSCVETDFDLPQRNESHQI